MKLRSDIELWFPRIQGKKFEIEIDNRDYNCVSYTLDIYDGWMWSNSKLWPRDIPRNLGINGFILLYKSYGYELCDSEEYELGYDKISFYEKRGRPQHAAKQFGKIWKSKLGPSVIITHELDWICGETEDAYGEVSFIMKRERIN